MNGQWTDFVWLLTVLALITWLISAVAVELFIRITPKSLTANTMMPATACWAMALTPWLVPLLTIAAVIALSAGKRMGIIVDHCLHHPGVQHLHLCFEHLPVFSPSLFVKIMVVMIATGLMWRLWQLVRREWTLADMLADLRHLEGKNSPVLRSGQSPVLAFAGGIRRPLIVLSKALFSGLSSRQRRIVLAHEIAHVRQRDSLLAFLMEFLLSSQLPASRQFIRRSWAMSRELKADHTTAQKFGDIDVAETLVRAASLAPFRRSAPGWAVHGGDMSLRVHTLLAGPAPISRLSMAFSALLLLASFAAPMLLMKYHHTVETLLSAISGA